MGINYLAAKAFENIYKSLLEDSKGNLGTFSVSMIDGCANDIAKAAALQYHELDMDESKAFHKKYVLLKKRVGKSKFAKKTIEDLEEDNDPEVDEPTEEGSAFNDPKYQRLIKAHIVKLAQNNALRASLSNRKN